MSEDTVDVIIDLLLSLKIDRAEAVERLEILVSNAADEASDFMERAMIERDVG